METGLAVRGIARRNDSRAQRDFLDLADLITLRWLTLWNFASDACSLRFRLTKIFATPIQESFCSFVLKTIKL